MRPQDLEQQWQFAQACEAQGDLVRAREAYEGILAAAPRQPMVQLRLSALAEQQHAYRDARRFAVAAARTVATMRRWELLPFVTLRLLAFEERGLVQELIRGADWSSPVVLAQSASLSQHLWLIEDFEGALALLDEAQRRARPSHLLHYSRATVLRYLGRSEEATAEFERAIALAPDYAYAHWSLAYHARATPPDGRLERIEAALRANAGDADAQSHLYFALFKELDGVGRVDDAWQALATGAGMVRAGLRYESGLEGEGLAALRRIGLFHPQRPPLQEQVPVFIVGMPRTGTTVLERIVGNHPAVASAGELNAFAHALSEVSDIFVSSPPRARDVESLASVDMAAVGQAYLERTAGLYRGATHLLDKNPLNVFHAGWIARALPQARVLCLVRDPMDACFSNLKELFAGGSYPYSYDLAELAEHAARFADLVEHWETTLPESFKVVRYESMVADPEATAKDVLAFCGLEYRTGVSDITRNAAPSSTASSSQIREAVHGRGVGAWRRYARHLTPLVERLAQAGIA